MNGVDGANYTKYLIEEKINKTIIAKNDEIESIKKQFNYVLEGNSGISIITGPPGIGKTFLVKQMVKYILTLPFEELGNIKHTLIKAIGSDIEIITSISPYARKLFGHHKIISMDDYEKLKYRVRKAIYNFISIVSEYLFPIIMFIDDLQWADGPSLEILKLVCKDKELLNLLLIVSYRDNEEKYIKNDDVHIQLQELTDIDIKGYIQLIFEKQQHL